MEPFVESVASTVAAETFATAVDSAAASDPQRHILEVVHFLASIHLIFEAPVVALASPDRKSDACRKQPNDSSNPEATSNTVAVRAEQSSPVAAAVAADAADKEALDSKTSVESSSSVEGPPTAEGLVAVERPSWFPAGPCTACTACLA